MSGVLSVFLNSKGVTLLSHSAIYLKMTDLKTVFHLTFIDGQQNL